MSYLPNIVSVDLPALGHNLTLARGLLNPQTKIMGIVKSDAYGHGLLQVSQVLERFGVDWLGVAHLHEALDLRRNGIGVPIVILCGIRTREACREAVEKNLVPVVFDLESGALLSEEAVKVGKRKDVLLKVDTGMGRLGISHDSVENLVKGITGLRGLNPRGLISHLSSADETDRDFTRLQIDYFKKAVETCRTAGLNLHLNSLANSAGIMGFKDAHFDMVRPGIVLYGGMPSPEFSPPIRPKSVMGFKGRILEIRDRPDDTPVSYNRTYHTKGPQRIGVISAGYGDGIPRSISNRGKVLVKGKRVNIVGRVCMNMTMCDLTGLEGITPGEEVVFLGKQGEDMISGDDMARWGDTISYEIFCSLGQGSRKEYIT